MSTNTHRDGPAPSPGDHQITSGEARHKVGAVGLVGVLFMAVANAAPITAMSFNVPIAVGYESAYLPTLSAWEMVPPMMSSWSSAERSASTSA